MAASDPSTHESESSEETYSSEEGESSDQMEVIIDDMRSTNLGGFRQNPASNKGM